MTWSIRRAAAPALLLTVVNVLAACAGSTEDPLPGVAAPRSAPKTTPATTPSPTPSSSTADDAPPVGPQYVALGDSYAAAPGVPSTIPADGCYRSTSNYAQQLAARSGLTVTDVTCSGATTETVLADQVPAITPEAELVTVGIGGNDFDLFATLITSCVGLADSDPGGTPCTDAVSAQVQESLPRIGDNVGGLLDAVAEAAPDARVVVVGYPDLLPARGTCPDLVPLASGDYSLLNQVTDGLSDALRSQADERGLDYVDLAGPSRGHDICSAKPWVNGQTVAADGTIPFHPFALEQRAVARIIAELL